MPKVDFDATLWYYLVDQGVFGKTEKWARTKEDIDKKHNETDRKRGRPRGEIVVRREMTLKDAIRIHANRYILWRRVEDPRNLFPEYWRFDDFSQRCILID